MSMSNDRAFQAIQENLRALNTKVRTLEERAMQSRLLRTPGSFTTDYIPFGKSNGRLEQSIGLSYNGTVFNVGATTATATSGIELGGNATGNRIAYIDFHGDDTNTDFGLRIIRNNGGANTTSIIQHRGTGILSLQAVDAGVIAFYTNAGAERMRISSTGNVGIGTAAASAKLDVMDGYIRARDGANNAPAVGAGLELLSTGGAGYIICYNRDTATWQNLNEQANLIDYSMNTVAIARLSSAGLYLGGNVTASKRLEIGTDSAGKPTTNTWQIISDERTKRNVTPYKLGFDLIKQINPVQFEYNGKGGTPEGDGGVGVIAQEIEKFAPQMVRRVKTKVDKDDDDRLEYQGNEVQYAMINAMKEAFGRIEQLEARDRSERSQR